jgi:hypothetical protein
LQATFPIKDHAKGPHALKWHKVILATVALGLVPELHAAVYVDPSSTGLLMTVFAPIFILISALGLHFKRAIQALLRRIFNKPDMDRKDPEDRK